MNEMDELKIGDRVSFPVDGAQVEATTLRVNRKSVSCASLDGRRWRVHPALITKVADGSAARNAPQAVYATVLREAHRTLVDVRHCPVCDQQIVCTQRKDEESFTHAEYDSHFRSAHADRCVVSGGRSRVPYANGYLAYRYGDGELVALAR